MRRQSIDLACFFGDDGFQNMFVYQSTFDMLELKIDNGTMFLVGNKRSYILLNLTHCILPS